MNKYKDGSLTHVSLNAGGINTYSIKLIEEFFESFMISEKDHEMWYGEEKVAKDMKKEQLVRKFHFGLKQLDLGHWLIVNDNKVKPFRMKVFEKLPDPQWPYFIQFLNQCSIESLDLSGNNIGSGYFETITTAISNKPYACKDL